MTLFTFTTADALQMEILDYISKYFWNYTNQNDLIGAYGSPEISKQDYEIAASLMYHVKGNTCVDVMCNDIITGNFEISY